MFELMLSLLLVSSEGASLQAKGLELLQKGKKAEALTTLEKAFEKSQDPDEIREIAILILEASPETYSRRESYLRYLLKSAPEHGDAVRWLKEMGDRMFDKAQFEEAEDFYLQSASRPDADKDVLDYKIAWVEWNLKRREEALNRLLDVYAKSEGALRQQILRDIPKIWIDIGKLPQSLFDRMSELPNDQVRELTTYLLQSFSPQMLPGDRERQLLQQLKANGVMKEVLLEDIQRGGITFRKSPCFFFDSILESMDAFSEEQLLNCAKTRPRQVPAERLLTFFQGEMVKAKTEKWNWAHAEILIDLSRLREAAAVLDPDDDKSFKDYSAEYLTFYESILLKLNDEDFRSIYDILGVDRLKNLLEVKFDQALLERLQKINPETWVDFEQQRSASSGKKPSRSLLEKRGILLAKKVESDSSELEDLSALWEELSSQHAKTPKEKKLREEWNKLKNLPSSQSLPSDFSQDFVKKYGRWLKDMDRAVDALSAGSATWNTIAKPLFVIELEKNISAISAQIDSALIDPSLAGLEEEFKAKKDEMKAELKKRYSTQETAGEKK